MMQNEGNIWMKEENRHFHGSDNATPSQTGLSEKNILQE